MADGPLPWWLGWKGISFTWDLWYACNYRCSYCWWELDGLWDKLAKKHKLLSPEQWAGVWRPILERYGEAKLDLLGGEPLLYPKAAELLRRLSELHRLQVTTNLSLERPALEAMVRPLSPERVHFNASYHPGFAPLEPFLEKALWLKAEGFDPAVSVVTWPPLLARLEELREAFLSRDIVFYVNVFQGAWEGRTYPEAFTPAQQSLLKRFTTGEEENTYRLLRASTRGKLCHAGRIYANVKADGEVFRCGQDAFGRRSMGNLFEPGFSLHETAQPCPYERCSCLEFQFLDEVMNRERVRAAA